MLILDYRSCQLDIEGADKGYFNRSATRIAIYPDIRDI
jgi:hypothetical protein